MAERQFMQSDPENRLVTGELERRWEASLREWKSAEEQLVSDEQRTPTYVIPADLLQLLKEIGPRLPELWNADLLKTAQKISLLRSIIDKVVIHRESHDRIQTRVVWRGGATTGTLIRVTVGKLAWLSNAQEMEATIETMARNGHSDVSIAEHLTAHGHCSPRADKMLPSTVRLVRLRKRLLIREHQSHPCRVPGFLTIPQLAEKLGVSRWWIHDRIRSGTIKSKRDGNAKCYLFPDTPETLAELKATISEFQNKLARGRGHQHA